MAFEARLVSLTQLPSGNVLIKTAAGVYGDLPAGAVTQEDEKPSLSDFLSDLADKEQAFLSLLPYVPLFLQKRKTPGDVAALLAVKNSVVIFDTDPGQPAFTVR